MLLADPEGHQPPQETEEVRRRKAEIRGKRPCRPGPRAHPIRQPKFHHRIGKRRGVIRLDLRPQPVFAVLPKAHLSRRLPPIQGGTVTYPRSASLPYREHCRLGCYSLTKAMTDHPDKVLIVDFGAQYTQLIARRVRDQLGVL